MGTDRSTFAWQQKRVNFKRQEIISQSSAPTFLQYLIFKQNMNMSRSILLVLLVSPDSTFIRLCKLKMFRGFQVAAGCALGAEDVIEFQCTDEDIDLIVGIHNDLRQRVAWGQETRGSPGPQPAAVYMPDLVNNWDVISKSIVQLH